MRCDIGVVISVIVPVYNVRKYLSRCIESLVSQTIVDKMEIMIIDDGSTDGCGNICDEYSKKFPFVVTIHQKNKGVSAARNKGIENAIGEYIAFVDADDYVEADYFEKMFSAAQITNADLIVFDYWLTFENGVNVKYRNTSKDKTWLRKEALKNFLSGGLIGVNLFDKLFTKKGINNLQFDERIKVGEDMLFIYKYLLNANLVYGNFQAGYHYYQRNDSTMNANFSHKFFDVLEVSNRIRVSIKTEYADLLCYAEALYIYSEYKTLERAYKFHASECYNNKLDKCRRDIKKYKFKKAIRYLSFKRFAGFCLFRTSPRIYLFICKIMNI